MTTSDRGIFDVGDTRLEYRVRGPRPQEAPTLVLIHDAPGVPGEWGSFADELAAATGAGVLTYSRAGSNHSSPPPAAFMHEEARAVLPRLLDATSFRRGLLIGHGDGAAIAVIYAGSVQDHRVRGLVLMAPRFLVNSDIPDALAHIRVPILIVQGEDDPSVGVRQIEVARRECYCPVEVALLPAAGQMPHREAPAATLAAVAGFVVHLLRDHGERRFGDDLRDAADRA